MSLEEQLAPRLFPDEQGIPPPVFQLNYAVFPIYQIICIPPTAPLTIPLTAYTRAARDQYDIVDGGGAVRLRVSAPLIIKTELRFRNRSNTARVRINLLSSTRGLVAHAEALVAPGESKTLITTRIFADAQVGERFTSQLVVVAWLGSEPMATACFFLDAFFLTVAQLY